jgi:plastocyanin
MSRRLVTLLLGLLLPLALVAMACGGGTATVTFDPPPSATTPASAPAATAPTAPSADSITIDLTTTGDLKFAPAAFELEAGKSYTFNIKVNAVYHTFTIRDLSIDAQLPPNTTQTVSVKVDKSGTYKLICIPHENAGMVGTVTVT